MVPKFESTTQRIQNTAEELQQTPPSQEERPTQLLKLTEGKKLSLEFLVILCKLHLQPELQGIALQLQEVSWLCVR